MGHDPFDYIDRIIAAQDPVDLDYEARQAIADGVLEELDGEQYLIPLLKAEPHKWGHGLIHQIDEERDQTLCGKSPGGCPGTRFWGSTSQITCKACLRSLEARAKAEELRRHYEESARSYAEQERQYQQKREDENRRWWAAYNAYLASPEWQARRAKVLRRSNGTCEGCGERSAIQVHHLRYPRGCTPGSPEWLAQEMLFDLTAICERCHSGVHSMRRISGR